MCVYHIFGKQSPGPVSPLRPIAVRVLSRMIFGGRKPQHICHARHAHDFVVLYVLYLCNGFFQDNDHASGQ